LGVPSTWQKPTKQSEEVCVVNTFGFGQNHNAKLLKSIAETTSGLYFFIESRQSIGESLVDCVGGLLSVVAQHLHLSIKAEGKTELVDASTPFPKTWEDGKKN